MPFNRSATYALLNLSLVIFPFAYADDSEGEQFNVRSEIGGMASKIYGSIGDEISTLTGALSVRVPLVNVPGNGGLGIDLGLTYSFDHGKASYPYATTLPTIVGQSWDIDIPHVDFTISYLEVLGNGCPADPSRDLDDASKPWIFSAKLDGRKTVSFRPSQVLGNVDYVSEDGYAASCMPTEPNGGILITSPQGTRYYLNKREWRKDQPDFSETYYNRVRYYVSKIEDTNGNTLTYQYTKSASHNRQLPTRISASDGREVSIRYKEINTYRTVYLIDELEVGDRIWRFSYKHFTRAQALSDGDAVSDEFYSPTQNELTRIHLTRIELPDGRDWNFRYFDYTFPATKVGDDYPGMHQLRNISSPGGSSASYTYVKSPYPPYIFGSSNFKNYVVAERKYRRKTHYLSSFVARSYPQIRETVENFSYQYDPTNSRARVTIELSNEHRTVATHYLETQHLPAYRSLSEQTRWSAGTLLNLRTTSLRGDDLGEVIEAVDFEYENHSGSPEIAERHFSVTSRHCGKYCSPVATRVTTTTKSGTTEKQVLEVDDFNRPTRTAVTATAKPYAYRVGSDLVWGSGVKREFRKVRAQTYRNTASPWKNGLVVSTSIDEDGESASTYFDYDSKGNLTLMNSNGLITAFSYYPDGSLKEKNTGSSYSTYSDYFRGLARTINHGGVLKEARTYNYFGELLSTKVGTRPVTNYIRNSAGNLTSIDLPPGQNNIAVNLDFENNKISTTQGNKHQSIYFDSDGREEIIQHTDLSSGESWAEGQDFDKFGRLTAVFDRQGSSSLEDSPNVFDLSAADRWVNSYDASGKLASRTRAAPSKYQYDTYRYNHSSDQVVEITSPEGRIVRKHYLVYPGEEPQLIYISMGNLSESISYNPSGEIRFLGQNGLAREYRYGANSQLTYESHPEKMPTTYTYDAAGLVQKITSGELSINYIYDSAGRIDTKTAADGSWFDFDYDDEGRLASVEGSNGVTWSYVYDNHGKLTNEYFEFGGTLLGVTHVYNANGDLTSTVYPSGRSVPYAPNVMGMPTKIGSYVPSISYSDSGDLAHLQFRNNVTINVAYNPFGRASSKVLTDARGVMNRHLDMMYDADLMLTGVADTAGIHTQSYGYDSANRLSSWSSSGRSFAYNYDANNNMSGVVSGADVTSFSYDSQNRLSSITLPSGSVSELTYDDDGNVVRSGSTGLEYNAWGMMSGETGSGSEYLVDHRGMRYSKTIAGSETLYFYGLDGTLYGSYANDGTFKEEFLYVGGTPVVQVGNRPSRKSAPQAIVIDKIDTDYNAGESTFPVQSGYYITSEQSYIDFDGNVGFDITLPPGEIESLEIESTNLATMNVSVTETTDIYSAVSLQLEPANYSFRLRACNSIGCSSWTNASSEVLVTPAIEMPTLTITGFESQIGMIPVMIDADQNVQLDWQPIADADSYKILNFDQIFNLYNPGELTGNVSEVHNAGLSTNVILNLPFDNYWITVAACKSDICRISNIANFEVIGAPEPIAFAEVTPGQSTDGNFTFTVKEPEGKLIDFYFQMQEMAPGGSWSQIGNFTREELTQDSTYWLNYSLEMNRSNYDNGTYSYRARGCNIAGCSAFTSAGDVEIAIAPSKPTISRSTSLAKQGNVTISWSTEPSRATTYTVYKSGGAQIYEGTGSSFSYKHPSSEDNEYFRYRVKACYENTCTYSEWSAQTRVLYKPGRPSSISVPSTALSATEFTISWGAATGVVDKYQVFDADNSNFNQQSLSYSGGARLFRDARGGSGYSLWFRVRACNDAGCSSWRSGGPMDVIQNPYAGDGGVIK